VVWVTKNDNTMALIEKHFSEIMEFAKVAPWAIVALFAAWRYYPVATKWVDAWASRTKLNTEEIIAEIIKKLDERYVKIGNCHTHIDAFRKEQTEQLNKMREEISMNQGIIERDIERISKTVDTAMQTIITHLGQK